MYLVIHFFLVLYVIAEPRTSTPNSPFAEIDETIPDSQKGWIYYSVMIVFVLTTVTATILTGAFLILSIFLWSYLKPMKFFWFLIQLTVSAFVISALNLVFNVPATLFSAITQAFVQSDMHFIILCTIEFFTNSIMFSNLAIAFQRFFVFFHLKRIDVFFNSPYMFIWLILIWVLPILVVFLLFQNSCVYKYDLRVEQYKLQCYKMNNGDMRLEMETPTQVQTMEDIIQIAIPIMILVIYIALVIKIVKMKRSSRNKTEVTVLKQAVFIFIMFQVYNIVTLYAKTIRVNAGTAFYLKRIIHTSEILAGAVTPCFVFFTSREIRKLITSKVTAGSQGNSIPQNNRRISFRQQS